MVERISKQENDKGCVFNLCFALGGTHVLHFGNVGMERGKDEIRDVHTRTYLSCLFGSVNLGEVFQYTTSDQEDRGVFW